MYRTKIIRRLAFFSLFLSLALNSACETQSNYTQEFLQFGTLIDITLASTTADNANAAFAEIEALLVKRHSDWHGWEDGTLTRFNKALSETPDKGIPVPQNLQRLIADSKKYYKISGGLFNPAMGKLIGAWGFHGHAEADLPLIERIKKDIPGMDDLQIRNNLAYSSNPFLQLDFGGIAKGLAILEISQLLEKRGINNYIINAGGDIYAGGVNAKREWRVAIQDPFKENVIGAIEIAPSQSIFTSGNYRRFHNLPDHKKTNHIINPKTGDPSQYISSATVITNDPILADAAATTLMLVDKTQIKNMAKQLGIKQYMIITDKSEVFISQSMYDALDWHEQQQFKIEVQ
jgi:FAD:protein FMN transferase